MHRPKIIIEPDTPKEIADALLPIVQKWLWLAPSWCRTLYLNNGTANSQDHIARIYTSYSYRRATIVVYPEWLEGDTAERERNVVHELCHLFTSPMADWMTSQLEKLVDGEASALLLKTLQDELTDRVEGCTCDLTAALTEQQKAA